MAHADIADTILAFAQRLDDRIDAVADNAEHERCAPGNQRLDQNIEGVNLRRRRQNRLRRHLGVGSEAATVAGRPAKPAAALAAPITPADCTKFRCPHLLLPSTSQLLRLVRPANRRPRARFDPDQHGTVGWG